MYAGSQGIEARVRALAEEVTSRAGYELVDVEYRREPAGWTLRLFVDKPGGVSLDDCRRLSHEFGTILEVEDPIPHKFNLEVSSPGLDRPLKKEADFVAAIGRRARIVSREPIAGRRHFAGLLVQASHDPSGTGEEVNAPGATGNSARLLLRLRDDTGVEHVIPADEVARAQTIYEWPEPAAHGSSKQGQRSGTKPGRNRGRNG